ncbi:hypothetical protein I4I73_10730 [Pseudonocardia sp. KRD-184]|uniref:Uncharacterized protein n=1 Tax=Pseudonocardia oceani TaxID=2792013 RepID=A0ABS6U840_9PSEU|nr:hypothetical protein [Pseudonocardia oceani]MBW0089456.1 hypothetical protein [Pseudonocardia oceani]MBW0096462.1 hypothetical protein [Pseudonocardia oceani]MBW0109156.1 hypothetical protein [Pseudonocardia oceani]MBW0120691.1 hypothetical protein [Pseudonocardia oceani]MBW0128375.1 hypothetical protein [Pseudonocardia oceani]
MTAAVHAPLRLVPCRDACPGGARRAHHDRLLTVDTDTDALLELIELAVTWHELEHPRERLVGPQEWATFAERHHWADPDRAERAFVLAADIVDRHAPALRARAGRTTMLDLITG